MVEYKITKSDLGYNVVREVNGVKERLQKDTYTLNRQFARIFYTIDDAVTALIIARRKGDKIPTISIRKSEFEGRREKTSWSEL